MAEGRRADSTRRRQRALKALTDAVNQGDEITVSGIARRAGIDRSFLYRHHDLLEQIHATAAQPPSPPGNTPGATRASLQADLLNSQQRVARLASRVHQLEQRLSEALGHQAWHNSGLGAPDDTDQLKQQVANLQQHTIDLRLQLEERDQHLDAARAANRDLITRLNAPRHAMSTARLTCTTAARTSTVHHEASHQRTCAGHGGSRASTPGEHAAVA